MKNDKGFTLLEVLLVVGLLGIILAITVPNIAKGSDAANEELCTSSRLIIRAAIEQYEAIEKVTFSGGNVENLNFVQYLAREEYLKNPLQCPSGGIYTYEDGEVECSEHTDQD
ncbi:prepilin-type N-terminal cleavage/methylation domain-containing protein [Alkalicella caledoniensis]|uniref:Prepilin-type N-terminal cleavage/methylation domain-containing protein n=1 Tax=Alkalicella caledoniensis TaxID=2731377 RepID=A0A7G9W584_ALKCA|nr:prepilin-type N-terminal cleavage/methylation domain-containing protein [Alkalicella caledoniensis]QNO13846.1 prepilin-type N-terminal cleavage/methylation domain-containing protein [Alkalicella caledoniensis]